MDDEELERAIALSKQHLKPAGSSEDSAYNEQLARAIALSKAHATRASSAGAAATNSSDFLGATFRSQMRIEKQIEKNRRKSALARVGSFEAEDVHDKTCRQEKEAMSILSGIVATCMSSGSNFLDPSFPPSERSLFGREGKTSKRAQAGYGGREVAVGWAESNRMKPTTKTAVGIDVKKDKWVVFRSEVPGPDDIQQGGLGDCYFLSALACITQRPALIRNLFVGPKAPDLVGKLSEYGVYQVRLCHNGYWHVITLDSMLPVNEHGAPAFACGARMQIWPALVEKAYAKACGCYSALERGGCDEALSVLTGAPCDAMQLVASKDAASLYGGRSLWNVDDCWKILYNSYLAGFIMAACCYARGSDSPALYESMGLQTSHAYSVLQVTTVKVGAKTERLVQLRNPWGSGSWKGAWGVQSSVWREHPQLREQLGFFAREGEEHGVFWMALHDFFHYFGELDVCRVRGVFGRSLRARTTASEWAETRSEVLMRDLVDHKNQRFPAIAITVLVKTSLELTLHQPSVRGTDKDNTSIGIFVMRSRLGSKKYLKSGSAISNTPMVRHDAQLEAGEYVLVPVVLGTPKTGAARTTEIKMVVAINSSKPLLVKEMRLPPTVLKQALAARVLQHGRRNGDGETGIYSQRDDGALMTVVVNRSRHNCDFTMDLKGSLGLITTRQTLVTKDVVPTQCVQIVNVAIPVTGTWQSKSEYKWKRGKMKEEHEPGISPKSLHDPFKLSDITE